MDDRTDRNRDQEPVIDDDVMGKAAAEDEEFEDVDDMDDDLELDEEDVEE